MHACEASGALHLLTGVNGALRINSLSVRQRMAMVAIASPTVGRRASQRDHRGPARVVAVRFAAVPAIGVRAARAVGAVVRADRRRSVDAVRRCACARAIACARRCVCWVRRGAACPAPNGRPEDPQYAVAGAFGVHHGVASAVAVAAISVVVGLRGISDRVTHTLEPLPVDQTAGLLVVALWSLGGGLDALRLLARRAQTRRSTRVASSLAQHLRRSHRTGGRPDAARRRASSPRSSSTVGTQDELELVVPDGEWMRHGHDAGRRCATCAPTSAASVATASSSARRGRTSPTRWSSSA